MKMKKNLLVVFAFLQKLIENVIHWASVFAWYQFAICNHSRSANPKLPAISNVLESMVLSEIVLGDLFLNCRTFRSSSQIVIDFQTT